MSSPRRLALALIVLAWGALATALVVVVIGPVSVPAIALSISHASRLLVIAAGAAAISVWLCRGISPLLDDLARSRAPYVATLVFVLAATAALIASRGALTVGGADSAGYLTQAQRWRDARLHVPLPLSIAGVADPWVQSGFGLRPDATGTATVPTYPPGLPWLEAAALAIGGEPVAVRLLPAVAALTALLAIWVIVVAHAGYPGATFAVVVLATMPVFLFQALQPMSDVPALAAWLGAMAFAQRPTRARLAAAAMATAVAILIRPNLAPLALAVLWQARMSGGSWRIVVPIAITAAASVAAVAGVQWHLYGSPMQSGYGRASELFAVSYVPANIALYLAWLHESVAAPARWTLAIGAVALVVRAARDDTWRPVALMATITAALYLVYIPFDSWTYLRFVLVPLALVPTGAAALGGAPRRGSAARWTFPVVAAVVLAVALPNLRLARDLQVFDIRAREYRYQAAGAYVRDHLPDGAVIVATQHSASAPYYSGRPVLRADLLSREDFLVVTAWAARESRPLVFVLDVDEPDRLRQRVGEDGLAALDWPPRAEVGRPVTTRVWFAPDREQYAAGRPVPTVRLIAVPK